MSRPKSERGITVGIGVSHAHPPSVWTSAASAARTQARPLVRRFTELEATGAPTAPQGARYAASRRSVWRRTLAPRSIASRSLVSSTRWLRPPLDGMKIIPASVIAARFCASWPAAEYRCVERRPGVRHACSMARWTRAAQAAGVVAGASHADDRVHDADRDPRLLEPRPLLDVELDVRGDRAGGCLRLRDAARVEARPRHRVDQALAVDGRHRLDPREVEPAAEGP